MKNKKILIIIIIVILLIVGFVFLKNFQKSKCGDGICQKWEQNKNSFQQDCVKNEETGEQNNVYLKTLTENGGNVDLFHKNNIIAFDRLGEDGYFDVWTMNPDGSSQKRLTCENSNLPKKHIGNPAWHPSGDFLVMQVEKSLVPKKYDKLAAPGAGSLNDLYIISSDGKRVWLLYSIRDEISQNSAGILHPHFSHDGKKLAWSERIKDNGRAFGEWAIKIADFQMADNGPKLSNIETVSPSQRSSFYETHTFSPDDSKLLFTGNQDGGLEVYAWDLKNRTAKILSDGDPKTWDEHATYSPDGKKIIWMSSMGEKFVVKPFYLETEFWMMDADGQNKKQLTHFNQKGSRDYFKKNKNDFAVAADNSWGPDGKSFVGLVITADPNSEERDKGRIILLDLNNLE